MSKRRGFLISAAAAAAAAGSHGAGAIFAQSGVYKLKQLARVFGGQYTEPSR